MTRIRVLPYKSGSKSATALAEALGGRVLKVRGDSIYRPRADDLVINWGSSRVLPNLVGHDIVNSPDQIKNVGDKRRFFQLMEYAYPHLIPDFWTYAVGIPNEAFPIVCRTVLNGHSGQGIVIANTREDLVDAPLYVKYEKKQQEYRVHVGSSGIIAVQRKARRRDVPDDQVNWEIRNHDNGFVFVRNGFTAPENVLTAARQALGVSGLDFGAVDVIHNERQDRAYVLEINSAPGLEGTTVQDYVRYFNA